MNKTDKGGCRWVHSDDFPQYFAIPFGEELPRFFLLSACLSLPGIFVRDANASEESLRLKRFFSASAVDFRFPFCGREGAGCGERTRVWTMKASDIHGCPTSPRIKRVAPALAKQFRPQTKLDREQTTHLACPAFAFCSLEPAFSL